jgi:hypothetical protein
VHELEILLLVNRDASREFGTSEISERLQIDQTAIDAVMKSFAARGLVLYREAYGERLYRIDSSNKAIVAPLKELSQWYSTHRVRILEMIYSKPLKNIQTFADAFRFRKDED